MWDLVGNLEDRFSHKEAHMVQGGNIKIPTCAVHELILRKMADNPEFNSAFKR